METAEIVPVLWQRFYDVSERELHDGVGIRKHVVALVDKEISEALKPIESESIRIQRHDRWAIRENRIQRYQGLAIVTYRNTDDCPVGGYVAQEDMPYISEEGATLLLNKKSAVVTNTDASFPVTMSFRRQPIGNAGKIVATVYERTS
jgi:hypothetical protein